MHCCKAVALQPLGLIPLPPPASLRNRPDRYVPLFGSGSFDLEKMRDAEPFESQLSALKELVDSGKVR